jgi:hypothetical protein
MVLSELVLGQRVARETRFCESCPGPRAQRAYIGCPECGTWHPAGLWSKRKAFGNWLGFVCPGCGGTIPCVRNVFSICLLGLTAPIWWFPLHRYGDSWRRWQWNRIRGESDPHADGAPEAIPRIHWIGLGAVLWGIPTGLLFSVVTPLFMSGLAYRDSVRWLLHFMPVWLVAGGGFGLTLRWVMRKWGAS